jgi:antimicrobial peptide system SdpB family protein
MTKIIDNLIIKLTEFSIYNKGLAIARASLAISTLLTIIFNSPNILFNPIIRAMNGEVVLKDTILEKTNLFKLTYESNTYWGCGIAVIILSIVILGIYPRITGILHFWVSYSFVTAAALVDGGDQINSNICLMLIPITLIDSRKYSWRVSNANTPKALQIISNIVFIIICLQVSLIYFQSSTSKFQVSEWSNGTSIYYWLSDPTFGLNPMQLYFLKPFITNPYIVTFVTWGTLLIEVLLFVAFFSSHKYYKIFFIAGVSLHLLFLIFIGLFSFFFTMLGALLLYLYIPWLNYSIQKR